MSGLPEKMRIYLAATKPLTDSGLFAQALSLVSNERREKVLRYRFMKDQRLSLGAGLLLEFALAEYGFPAGISLSYGCPIPVNMSCLQREEENAAAIWNKSRLQILTLPGDSSIPRSTDSWAKPLQRKEIICFTVSGP